MYPICLNIKGQLCTVVGGGVVAERKVLALLEAEARVRIISPALTKPLTELATEGSITWLPRRYCRDDLDQAFLVFAATDKREVQEEVRRDASKAGILINVTDAPEQSEFHVPAVIRQGDLTLTVSTNGKSPALAAKIRKQLTKNYGPEYAVLLHLMAQLREQVLAGDCENEERKILFQNILHDDILQWIKDGQRQQLRTHLAAVLGSTNIDFDLLL
ncbi:MAG: bifunctional precorrin-2 dehydrogenase/sirohydrochlorin ferrochelatase [Candidatus Electrothrix sp. AR3]|nr:bifunctional precorrin-2 dehydrogenase/sirohydrochlorin ferrochelatase [Candidatus Electrothrix sp. AR3]